MNIPSSFFKKKTERVLAVDIGSSSATTSIIEYGGSLPRVLASTSAEIAVLSDLTLEKFEKEMEKALKNSLDLLAKLNELPPERVVVFLSAPWYASQVRVAKMSRPSSFIVAKTLLNDLVSKELKAFEDEEIATKKFTPNEIRAIESKTVQAKLNGYAHTDPLGLSAREIEISIFVSVAPVRILDLVEKSIEYQYPHKPVTFTTFLSASFLVTRDLFSSINQYVLVDIGGEVTEVSIVKDGALSQSISFPRGRNFLLRSVSTGLNRSIAESVTICTLYLEDKIEDTAKEACTRVLNSAKEEWLKTFQSSLFSITNELSIPDTILITVDADVAPWFVETIQREDFHQYTMTEKDFKVVLLDSTFFHEKIAFKEGVSRDPFLMIEALSGFHLLENVVKK